MRGPGYRRDLDVRRVWSCAQCGKQRRLAGDVTTVACACGQSMHLVEPQHRDRFSLQPLVTRELTVASFELTAEELAQPVRSRAQSPPTGGPDAPATDSATASPARPQRKPRHGNPPPDAVAESEPELVAPQSEAIPPDSEADDFGEGLDEAPADDTV